MLNFVKNMDKFMVVLNENYEKVFFDKNNI